MATQGYLTALEAAYPEVRAAPRDEAWWPPFSGYTLGGEPLEARLRRCGFAWRHVVESRLPTHMEAILEQLALTVYALCCLPPAGVTPIWTLYNGLYELSSALHGDLVPRHILGASGDPRYPGALGSVTRLRALDASGDTSLASDLAWAQTQYAAVSSGQTGDARILAAHATSSGAAPSASSNICGDTPRGPRNWSSARAIFAGVRFALSCVQVGAPASARRPFQSRRHTRHHHDRSPRHPIAS